MKWRMIRYRRNINQCVEPVTFMMLTLVICMVSAARIGVAITHDIGTLAWFSTTGLILGALVLWQKRSRWV